jgi:hypothetical protein
MSDNPGAYGKTLQELLKIDSDRKQKEEELKETNLKLNLFSNNPTLLSQFKLQNPGLSDTQAINILSKMSLNEVNKIVNIPPAPY